MTTLLNLEAKTYRSSVLAKWAAGRPGAARRISNAQVYTTVSSDSAAMASCAPIASASGFAVDDRTAMAVSAGLCLPVEAVGRDRPAPDQPLPAKCRRRT